MRQRHSDQNRVVLGQLRWLLYQPAKHHRIPQHVLPQQRCLLVRRLERVERKLRCL